MAEESNIGSEFLAVGAEYDKERGLTDDANDFFTCNAYGVRATHTSHSSQSNSLPQKWPRSDHDNPTTGLIPIDPDNQDILI